MMHCQSFHQISVGGSETKVLTADGNLFLHDVDAAETGIYRCRQRSTGNVILTFNVRVGTCSEGVRACVRARNAHERLRGRDLHALSPSVRPSVYPSRIFMLR